MPTLTYLAVSGGMANRLRPLLSYKALADTLGLDFQYYWRTDPSCELRLDEAYHLPGARALSDEDYAGLEGQALVMRLGLQTRYAGAPFLVSLSAANDLHVFEDMTSQDALAKRAESGLILFDNKPSPVAHHAYFDALSRLTPLAEEPRHHEATRDDMAVHVRLTDFREYLGIGDADYEIAVAESLKRIAAMGFAWSGRRFFVASDEPVAMEIVRRVTRAPVYSFLDQDVVVKSDGDARDWIDNIERPKEAVRAALRDLETLAMAQCRIGNATSTFFKLARELSVARRFQQSGIEITCNSATLSLRKAATRYQQSIGLGPDDNLRMGTRPGQKPGALQKLAKLLSKKQRG